ncbi:esterase/lipase family protein [Nocardia sp. NPDC050408]|uniref:esterase/lipase family protein n=1 Tax=Nocardia sp. NPDC050408 TaxID=3364319 RepID=UPI0037BA06D1
MPVVNIWGSLSPAARAAYPTPQEPDDEWPLRGGTAWVYYSPLNQRQLTKPVILADGFSLGASDLGELWAGLENNGRYRFISELHAIGRDVIVLGYDNRAASIPDNANTAIECIQTAIRRRAGKAKLAVGGFSMGGMVTRYALAKMQHDPDLPDPETSMYLSYDTPHRGAWLPISMQAFAHFLKDKWGATSPIFGQFSDLINSPAARQMSRWHLSKIGDQPDQALERRAFLQQLDAVGGWPQGIRKIGVANGVRTGNGNGIGPALTAVSGGGDLLIDATLRTQAPGQQAVATLHGADQPPIEIRTDGLPDIDGAPGGLFPENPVLPGNPASFGMAAILMGLLGSEVELQFNTSCFIPSISAVAAGEIDNRDALYSEIRDGGSELDAFACASRNEGHTTMTQELGTWLVNEIDAHS